METAISSLRSFNRFFTRFVGALDPRFLGTDMTLGEARLLYEVQLAGTVLASDLQTVLDMDPGHVSRVLARFEQRGWITRGRGGTDARRRPIALTADGRAAFELMDARQRAKVKQTLGRLVSAEQDQLVGALATARILLDDVPARAFTIRTFRQGDMGLIVARQSILYHAEYGWGPQIEANEAAVTAAFLQNFKPGREQCWVAELDGVMAGSVFLTDEGGGLCRLRLLYAEPFARGRGIGRALVETCLAFARSVGYREVTLWTHTILASARRIYAAHGFRIVETHTHDTFGPTLQGETWTLSLSAGSRKAKC